jgi:hypothetical protein
MKRSVIKENGVLFVIAFIFLIALLSCICLLEGAQVKKRASLSDKIQAEQIKIKMKEAQQQINLIELSKHPDNEDILIYITKTGKIRIHSKEGKWLPQNQSGHPEDTPLD